ncbi:4'-phosphopantetheinyl transferase superfamily protein [Pseudohalioglobus sediminis]|uniref:4'-phosphopantetheinyl transferase superfamily protein n=1 Tax=Pseudohalioglobus sediminis TaxID=2606449 RepID=A0A5B0WTS4_9GAMM|nr:4'-phosphopantetheinyl transferase superfamily protein [Pseudohalioglobus sediminis]
MFDGLAVFSRHCAGRCRAEASHAGRRLLEDALAALQVRPTFLDFDAPFRPLADQLRAGTGLHLSISHSRGTVALALASGPVGIDVEVLDQDRNWSGIADQFFSDAEAIALRQIEPGARRRHFLQSWVMKEAYLKTFHGSVFGDLNRAVLTRGELLVTNMPGCIDRPPIAHLCETSEHVYGLIGCVPTPGLIKTSLGHTLSWRTLPVTFLPP